MEDFVKIPEKFMSFLEQDWMVPNKDRRSVADRLYVHRSLVLNYCLSGGRMKQNNLEMGLDEFHARWSLYLSWLNANGFVVVEFNLLVAAYKEKLEQETKLRRPFWKRFLRIKTRPKTACNHFFGLIPNVN